MVVVAVLVAPLVMLVASKVERRLGAAAAGWFAALPISFTVAIAAVSLSAGEGIATRMAQAAAAHVPAQVVFALVCTTVLLRHGIVAGVAAGAVGYTAASLAGLAVSDGVLVALALPLLAVGPRLLPRSRPDPAGPRSRSTTALTCLAGGVVVAAAVLGSRLAGAATGGTLAAFPTMSGSLAVAVCLRDGRMASAHVLVGLVRSLPCYLGFCVVVVAGEPLLGLPALAIALSAAIGIAALTWRTVQLPEPATA